MDGTDTQMDGKLYEAAVNGNGHTLQLVCESLQLVRESYFSSIVRKEVERFVERFNRSSGFNPFQVVYSMIPRGPLDLIPLPSKIRAHGKAAEFVDGLQAIHKTVHDNLV
ncbi:hypothetical protein MRB53_023139 [Persea americana]|uniref:Uncharacterized protein n=1 Tax=Persea americana TaxID=3435 RepID=A0ACC2L8J4_PERAE|nr:hypothetical protein MRB53_023139 [Persea americana]